MNGLIFMHEQKYLLAPTSEGSVLVYKTENIDSFIDRIQGHPGSVDAIVIVLLFSWKLMSIHSWQAGKMGLLEDWVCTLTKCYRWLDNTKKIRIFRLSRLAYRIVGILLHRHRMITLSSFMMCRSLSGKEIKFH